MKIKGLKKILLTSFMALLMMVINVLPEGFNIGMLQVYAEVDESGNCAYAILEDGTVEITGYYGNSTELVVPAEIDGYRVTSIGEVAFSQCSKLTSIEIPESITSIGTDAFGMCSSLTSIEIPKSVTSIGDEIFYGCDSLVNIDVAEDNMVYDSRENCNGIIETKTNKLIAGCKETKIPSGVTNIGMYAFAGCSGLTSIEIPLGVTSIGKYAFAGCSSLTSIEIPLGVTSIGMYAFAGCSSLTSIEIPESVTSIGDGAFESCSSLTSIEIPKSVTSIGTGAFSRCSSLTSIEIPLGVTSIGITVFAECSSLTSIEIPKSVTSIGNGAFSRCSSLTSIEIPESVISIGDTAFYENDNLVIYCYADTYAHTYAIEKEIEWKEIKDILPESTSISIEATSYTYDGEAKSPSIVVKYGITTLENGVDYSVAYTNNVNAGTATVTITGKGEYKGSLTKTFTINPATITDATLGTTTYEYDGKAKCPSVTVKCGTKILTNITDYTVAYTNNVNAGTATVTITGKGNYKGTVIKTFTIKEEKLSAVQSLKQSTSYATTSITLSWNKVKNTSGYEIYRAASKNDKYKKVAITSKTSYKDKKLKAGTTYYYKVRAYKNKNNYGAFSEIKAIKTKCVAPSIKLTAGKKQVKITWKKVTGATGYELYMSTSKSGKYKKITTLTAKKLSFTKNKLTKGKKYFFKAKSYSKINGKKVYSGWSKVGSVKVK